MMNEILIISKRLIAVWLFEISYAPVRGSIDTIIHPRQCYAGNKCNKKSSMTIREHSKQLLGQYILLKSLWRSKLSNFKFDLARE